MKVKYQKEIDDLLNNLFREEWMDDDDFEQIKNISLKSMNKSYESLNNDLEIGVQNGYPVEEQIKIIEYIIEKQN